MMQQAIKVLVVIITKDCVLPDSMRSVVEQDYADYSWTIFGQHPKHKHENPLVELYRNCSETRNGARRLALASDADAFLIMDSDIILPRGAISSFVRQASNQFGRNRIFGGWYSIRHDPVGRWVCGRWLADNVFASYRHPLPSIVQTDLVGLGCAFIPRKALAEIEFEDGSNIICRDERGIERVVGECGVFGNRAAERGYSMYMDGDVVCQHLER